MVYFLLFAVFLAIFLGCATCCLPLRVPLRLARVVAAYSESLRDLIVFSGRYRSPVPFFAVILRGFIAICQSPFAVCDESFILVMGVDVIIAQRMQLVTRGHNLV